MDWMLGFFDRLGLTLGQVIAFVILAGYLRYNFKIDLLKMENKLNQKIDDVKNELSRRIDEVEHGLNQKLNEVEHRFNAR
jgi:hypothetical protein